MTTRFLSTTIERVGRHTNESGTTGDARGNGYDGCATATTGGRCLCDRRKRRADGWRNTRDVEGTVIAPVVGNAVAAVEKLAVVLGTK